MGANGDQRPGEPAPQPNVVLSVEQWRAQAAAHDGRVQALLAGHRHRASTGEAHPVEDFLFTYYRLRPAQLAHWHPGSGVGLQCAPEFSTRRFYRTCGDLTSVDEAAFVDDRRTSVDFVVRLLGAVDAAPPQFGCFGLHEWAMVDDSAEAQRRHSHVGLRLGALGSAEVVHRSALRCTHWDAHRFFTASNKGRNLLQPSESRRVELEQPGCLHANMDLYKWAYKMLPVVSSTLVVDCFELARSIREVDMRASPYDLSSYGYQPIRVETPGGKAEYVVAQREFAARADVLRRRLIHALQPVRAHLTD